MPRGGARAGAGKPKGYKHKHTLEREAIRKAFAELLHQKALPIAARYFARAEGVFVMMIPTETGHERVRSEKQIIRLMSDPDLKNGRDYFLIEAVAPDAKVLLDFMARFDGKPTERVEIVTPEPIRVRFVDA
jgi:hypothetical protein